MTLAGKPVWPAGRSTERNVQAGFAAAFERPVGPGPVRLRVAAASRYRATVNGVFVGHGPARGPHGHYRVDDWDIATRLKPGRNVVAIEAAGYNVNSFYLLNQPSFVHAEVTQGAKVLASTAGPGAAFVARLLPERVQKVQRYSFQRPFTEVWRLTPGFDRWRTEPFDDLAPLEEFDPVPLLPHRAPLPRWDLLTPVRLLSAGRVAPAPMPARPWKDRSLTGIGPQLGGFPEKDLETIPSLELQALRFVDAMDLNRPYDGDWSAVDAGRWQILDFGANVTGFPLLTVRCDRPTTLWITFDEILSEGDVDFKRLGCVNAVRWDLEPGEFALETFEPYTLRYLKVFAQGGGGARIARVGLRELACPDAAKATFRCSDPQLEQIFEAARQTFRQNAVDLFMDCPSRERAGWLCDSFWTARVAFSLCGHTEIERCFFENYALPERFAHLPDGMLPMCYPSDHDDGVFIANWALWFVVELREYQERGGDPALVARLRERVARLFAYLQTLRNADGLLERVPSWVFVEWSRANDFVQDVNYPSNMLFAAALDAAGQLYANPVWRADAARVRETVRRQSYDGAWFVDNAVRRNGALERTTNRTETCQYYAFFFGVADRDSHPELWKRLVGEFGPERRAKGLHPEIHPANAFIGNYLRMELLARDGRAAQILAETRSYFGYMAERTGTLWENVDPSASCNHGFASHVAFQLLRDVAGIARVDPRTRTIRLSAPDVPLQRCDAQVPVPGGGVLQVGWKREKTGFRRRVVAPRGWKVVGP